MAKDTRRGRKAQPQARRKALAPSPAARARRPARGAPAGIEARRIDLVMRAVNEGVYDWDIAGGTIYYSEGVRRATGMSARQIRTPEDWRNRIHPEDLQGYDAALIAHFKGKTERFECDYRFRDRKGGWRWARQHGIAERDADGRAVRLVGSTGDITGLKQAEQALREAQERLALATQAATEGIYDWDVATGSLYLSERAKAYFAVNGRKLTPAAWTALVLKEDLAGYQAAIAAFFKGRRGQFECEYRLRKADGGHSWILDRAVALRDAKGRVTRLVGAIADVTQRKEAEIELRRARDEATEALEQQTATAEILRVISGSPENVQPVLDAVAKRAAQICEASDARIFLDVDGRALHAAGFGDVPMPFALGETMELDRGTVSGRAIIDAATVHVADMAAVSREEFPTGRLLQERSGYRTILAVPLLREGRALGTVMLRRREVRPFTDKQIALLGTFADQAAIAIENVRLFNETKEALERQTATAEVLKVIASSPSDVQPVFDIIAERAVALSGAHDGVVTRFDGQLVHFAAMHKVHPEGAEAIRGAFPCTLERNSAGPQAIRTSQVVHLPDVREIPDYYLAKAVDAGGVCRMLAVPLLREGKAMGAITLAHNEPGYFSDHVVELLKTFADQAVIAIENARLFRETREALERQTATSEILRVIASSPSDVEPVFEAIVRSFVSLSGGLFGAVFRFDGGLVHFASAHGFTEEQGKAIRAKYPVAPDDPSVVSSRAILTRAPVVIEDIAQDRFYDREHAYVAGWRRIIAVPMLREGVPLGAIVSAWTEPGPIPQPLQDLLKTFADQAVIAIENARLFRETREALERQTATAEILKVIAGSPADVQPVFEAIADNAKRLLGGFSGMVLRYDGELLHLCTVHSELKDQARFMSKFFPVSPVGEPLSGRCVLERAIIQTPDLRLESDPRLREIASGTGVRAVLVVPMLRDGAPIGTISVARINPGAFSLAETELLTTFADQAVIAIENVRLFRETREALERQTATAEILKVIAGSPSDVRPVFDAIVTQARKLVSGDTALVTRLVGDHLHLAAHTTAGDAGDEAIARRYPRPVADAYPSGAAIRARAPHQVVDVESDPEVPAPVRATGAVRGFRSLLSVPMLRDGEPIGTINVGRRQPGAFNVHQVGLLRTFADQAVIAIENVRLFNETREALERQTATADILRVISQSPDSVQPVFERIAERAARLCQAVNATVFTFDGKLIDIGGNFNISSQGDDGYSASFPCTADRQITVATAIRTGEVVEVEDVTRLEGYDLAGPARAIGYRRVLAVPMLHDGKVIGAIGLAHPEPGRFSGHQVSLVQTFADQAVIAIQNVRLFNETKEALEQQRASADVLGAISGSITNTRPVFDKILDRCEKLFEGNVVGITLVTADGKIDLAAYHGRDYEKLKGVYPLPLSRESGSGAAILDAAVVHYPDIEADGVPPGVVAGCRTVGMRAIIFAPMLFEGHGIGAIWVGRMNAGMFTQKQIALLRTFTDQAVIAIQNVRMFNETREALERQTATAEILNVIASSPSDVQPVFDAIAQSATRLLDGFSTAVIRVEGDKAQLAAFTSTGQSGDDALRAVFPVTVSQAPGNVGRAMREKVAQWTEDVEADTSMSEDFRAAIRARGWRSGLAVPMVRQGEVIGAINVTRREPGRFSAHQIGLLTTFADQAVIAIENVRLFNETKEALERQTATSSVLREISRSTFDLDAILRTLLDNAMRLCGAVNCAMFLKGADGSFRFASQVGYVPDSPLERALRNNPIRPEPDTTTGRALLERRTVHTHDIRAEQGYRPDLVALAEYRTNLAVPMLRDGEVMGAITLTRGKEVNPFTDKQIELVEGFSAQAVIAIENVRLFNETKDALERQTATAEILRVISSSPTDVQPVFEAIVASGMKLFSGAGVGIGVVNGDEVVIAAAAGMGGVGRGLRMPLSHDSASGTAILERKLVNIADTEAPGVPPHARENGRRLGIRSMVQAPMFREGEPIGSIGVMLKEPGGLDDKQLALLRTFADQAVIAIQNARLFNETREALERQTATAEVLKVIASSPSDVQPVFEAIAASARRLLDGGAALVARRDGDWLHLAAYTSTNEAADAALEKLWPSPITGKGHMGRAVVSASPVLVEDIQNDGSYSEAFRESARTRGVRSVVSVPMLREGEVIGVISVNRPVAGRFSEHQTNLLRTFADQAVIAIENVRLFKELQTRTEALTKSVGQLTALSEVGQAISSTLELDTVLKTIVGRAVQLSGLDAGVIYEYDQENDLFLLRASERFDESGVAEFRGATIRRGEGAVGRSVEIGQPTQVPDTHAPDYPAHLRGLLDRAGFRALLAVPLLREDHIVGALMVIRRSPGEFDAETVELLRSFAGQSALAIQNARLFREIAEKGRQLEQASQHKSNFLASMSHELRTPLNAILGFNEMILGQVYGEVPADMAEPLNDIQTSGKHLLRLINNVLDLAKIEAGRMELSLQDYSVHDLVGSVHSTLRPLAAEKGLEFLATVPEDLPLACGDGGRIAQCLMNLAGNSIKFTRAGKVEISVEEKDGLLTYRVSDTGIGIPPDKIASLFTEFKQTDATIASEYGGTGLGLSISKKFVEMHGGRIWIESELGKGSTFNIEVPLRVTTS